MVAWKTALLAIALSIQLSGAQSLIPIQVFTDNACNTLSTTATNVSIPLDSCITTVGMQSYSFPVTPCAGGGATSVQAYVYSDGHCVRTWYDYWKPGGRCLGAWTAGNAFGSILLTCKSSAPAPSSAVTINVGPVATGGSSVTSSGDATNSSSNNNNSKSGSGSISSSSNSDCAGIACLSTGEKIGLVVALAVGIPPIIISFYMCMRKRRERAAARAHSIDERGFQPPLHAGSWPMYPSPVSNTPPVTYQQQYMKYEDRQGTNISQHNNTWGPPRYTSY